MRFIVMVKGPENVGRPPRELMDGITKLGEAAKQAGVLVDTGGLLPSAMGARVKSGQGKVTVTDGPFTEAKEIIGGFAVYELTSKEDAIAWTTRFMELHNEHWPEWEGVAEIRQLFNPDDFRPGAGPC